MNTHPPPRQRRSARRLGWAAGSAPRPPHQTPARSETSLDSPLAAARPAGTADRCRVMAGLTKSVSPGTTACTAYRNEGDLHMRSSSQRSETMGVAKRRCCKTARNPLVILLAHRCDIVPAHRPKAGRHGLCGQLEQLDHARHRHARLRGPRHTVSAISVYTYPSEQLLNVLGSEILLCSLDHARHRRARLHGLRHTCVGQRIPSRYRRSRQGAPPGA